MLGLVAFVLVWWKIKRNPNLLNGKSQIRMALISRCVLEDDTMFSTVVIKHSEQCLISLLETQC